MIESGIESNRRFHVASLIDPMVCKVGGNGSEEKFILVFASSLPLKLRTCHPAVRKVFPSIQNQIIHQSHEYADTEADVLLEFKFRASECIQ